MSAGGRRNGDGYLPADSLIRRVAGTPLVHVLGVAPRHGYAGVRPLSWGPAHGLALAASAASLRVGAPVVLAAGRVS